MKQHDLKTDPGPFQDMWDGYKRFEIRPADRRFARDDILVLREWYPYEQRYTGRHMMALIIYVSQATHYGLQEGYVAMGIIVRGKYINNRQANEVPKGYLPER